MEMHIEKDWIKKFDPKKEEITPIIGPIESAGVGRKCPNCGLVAHYKIKGRKVQKVECPECDFEFEVRKYERNKKKECLINN
jgi:predicted RNA-binding Zn-ribbon protein involved in translation (DUF1610 family)